MLSRLSLAVVAIVCCSLALPAQAQTEDAIKSEFARRYLQPLVEQNQYYFINGRRGQRSNARSDRRRPPSNRSARQHAAIERGVLDLIVADTLVLAEQKVSIKIERGARVIESNGSPEHKVGDFSRGPNTIRAQNYRAVLPLYPVSSTKPHFYQLGVFGIALNGVTLNPQPAEWYMGNFGSAWQYEPSAAALPLRFDTHFAHVNAQGEYHYHGRVKPETLGLDSAEGEPVQVGWALDGFPIYVVAGDADAQPSYQLRSGMRTEELGMNPGGEYDGTFQNDYEYVPGSGNLDECNGKYITNDAFPNGSYAYFLTQTFPIVPRCFRGTPVRGALRTMGDPPHRGSR